MRWDSTIVMELGTALGLTASSMNRPYRWTVTLSNENLKIFFKKLPQAVADFWLPKEQQIEEGHSY